MNKHIYIDCQSFQTEAWDRGMGRYTMSLIESLYQFTDDYTYTLIFSKNLIQNDDAVKLLKQALPDANVVELDLKPTNRVGYESASRHNKGVLNSYVKKSSSTESISFLIPSLFQEPTASIFPDFVQKSLIYYDAIPFLYYQRYKEAIDYPAYMQRFKSLYEADIIFTISQTIADDLMIYFGIANGDCRSIVNIDGACNTEMFSRPIKPVNAPTDNYILLPSSSDIRKNNRNAVKAFEQLRTLTSKDYKLVITSTFSKQQRNELLSMTPNHSASKMLLKTRISWKISRNLFDWHENDLRGKFSLYVIVL